VGSREDGKQNQSLWNLIQFYKELLFLLGGRGVSSTGTGNNSQVKGTDQLMLGNKKLTPQDAKRMQGTGTQLHLEGQSRNAL
jgi:hypothetical protein